MITTTIIFVILALFLFILNRKKGKHWHGLKAGLRQLVVALPVILLALFLAGLLEVLIPEEFIKRWLAQEAGFTGIILGTFGGMIMAFGPYASYPVIATIYGSGAGLGTTLALVAGWTLLGLSRVPFESSFFGFRFSLLRMAVHLPLCIFTGVVGHFIELLFL